MTGHAMRYVSLGERVLREGVAVADVTALPRLQRANEALIDAEIALVAAYREWRDAVAAVGTPEAKRALERTTWDLT